MYLNLRDRPSKSAAGAAPTGKQRVARTVLLLGAVSLLTDVSSESVNAILPIYLTTVLGLSTFAYGLIDGIYQGVSALIRLLGGWIADRTDRPKLVATFGYGISAISRVALIPMHSFAAITSVITLDRLGKGVRTAPRDALIASSSAPESLGRAFGVHRSLDTVGAMIGPLLAFWILIAAPTGFRTVFIASFAFAIIGFAVLVLFVPNLRPQRTSKPAEDASRPAAPKPSLRLLLRPGMIRLCCGAALLGVLTIGDGFLYLELTERDSLATKYFPLLYVGSNIAYLAFAIPLGRLADRIGRTKVFVGGHLALLAAYIFAGSVFSGAAATVGCLVMLGSYYAATDGVLAAIAGQLVPPAIRTSGIATAQTVLAMARFVASLGFGLLWTTMGRVPALHLMIWLLIAAIPIAAFMLRGLDRSEELSTA
ncbi:MAG: major facilitator transporter [Frankiales bacterium]|nr:major facilitator transporter [Frankiales bacterium]